MAEHYCEFHQTDFFKTEKMRGYAHPIKDKDGKTVGWCNEDAKEVAKLPEQSKDEMLDEHQEVVREARVSVSDGKNRSFALSYAKDWCIAKVQGGEAIKTLDVLVVAKAFEAYLDTGVVVEKKK